MEYFLKLIKQTDLNKNIEIDSPTFTGFFGSQNEIIIFNLEMNNILNCNISGNGPYSFDFNPHDINSSFNSDCYLIFIKDDVNNTFAIEYVPQFVNQIISTKVFNNVYDKINDYIKKLTNDSIIDYTNNDFNFIQTRVLIMLFKCYLCNCMNNIKNSTRSQYLENILINILEPLSNKIQDIINNYNPPKKNHTRPTATNTFKTFLQSFLVNSFSSVINIANYKLDKIGLNTILFGPPGTGKTYNSKYVAVSICTGIKVSDLYKDYDYTEINKIYENLLNDNRIGFVTFHQSYGYEEFIGGIGPELKSVKSGTTGTSVATGTTGTSAATGTTGTSVATGTIIYKYIDGVFKEFCQNTTFKSNSMVVFKKNENNPAEPIQETINFIQNRCFIIDEINRGNISKIFGELITLIEPSKRIGGPDAMTAKLPNCDDPAPFGVPNNVYILGTMNTADRSIALLDTALRRRFNFVEMLPNSNIVDVTVSGIEIKKMLDKINERIAVLYDREHTIGHAFFTSLNNSSSFSDLESIFKNKIMPLLQEYFYDDYEKIKLVLNDFNKNNPFINKKTVTANNLFNRNNNADLELPNYIYEVSDNGFKDINNYRNIYS